MKNFKNYTIFKHISCLEALKKLNIEKSNQTLFVLDEYEHLIGTVTDGDIRRGLIRGLNIETEIQEFSCPDFRFISGKINVPEIHRLKKEGIRVLPKLNAAGQIERVFDLSHLFSILPLSAVIMAGGRGERLRPLTDNIPKSMLPLGNKPIIEHNIDRLISFGIESITISVRYLSDQIINYLGNGSDKGISIKYIEEDAPLGTIGCLSLIENVEQDAVLVLNSDVFTSIDYENFFLNFINTNADMAVASIPYTVDIPYAIMELNENSIINFEEKPKNTYYANAGIYLIKKEYIKRIPKGSFYNATDLMKQIISSKGKLVHSPITGYWIDIGKHDDYMKALEIVKHL
jgi:dTDP-glucose pyrophosphorylase